MTDKERLNAVAFRYGGGRPFERLAPAGRTYPKPANETKEEITMNDNNSMDLKPCPFCGRPAHLYVSRDGVEVVCTGWGVNGCGCRTEHYHDWQETTGLKEWSSGRTAVRKAVDAWNRREADK